MFGERSLMLNRERDDFGDKGTVVCDYILNFLHIVNLIIEIVFFGEVNQIYHGLRCQE